MSRKCCIPKCNNLRKDVKLHQFPAKEEISSKWLECIGCESIGQNIKGMFVCHDHFEQKFVNVQTNRLRSDAYPSLFTDLEITSGKPSKAYKETDPKKAICNDHTYAAKRRRHIDHSYSQPNKVAIYEDNVTFTMTSVNQEMVAVASTSTAIQQEQVAFTMAPVDQEMVAVASSSIEIQQAQVSCPTPSMEHGIVVATSSSTATLDAQDSSCKTPRKMVKKRLVRNVNSLTPRCQKFYEEYKKVKHQNYKYRAKKALNFSKDKCLEDLTKNMNPLTKKVLMMQVKLCTKNKKARRFTREEKLIALAIYKQGPKSYKFLQKIFILPSKTTLKKMISQLNIGAGINPHIFEHLKRQVAKWSDRKKICTVMYDEMAIDSALTYAAQKDNIVGFVELNDKIKKFADHALVFMLRGAVFKWQQPIAFYFCEGATSSVDLKVIIKAIIAAVVETGLTPIALVSDQGSSFQAAINSLLDDSKRDQLRAGEIVDDTIHLNGHCLSVFFDPPHLLKGIRNNWLTKDMLFNGKKVTWNDIVDVYTADCKHGESRILHKLTDQHVIPEKIKKMKVKNCVRVLSKSVSAALSYTSTFPFYPDGKPVSGTLKDTAEAVSFFDDLFDSVNGATTVDKKSQGKHLRKSVTSKSQHHEFWNRAIKILEGTKYISKNGTLKSVSSIKNWVITLKSFKRVWELLASKNIKIMRPRYFNSDTIENFFGQVRAYNYRSNDPTAYAFVNTFKSLLITRFINFHSESYNCEEDVSKGILDIQSLFENVNTAPVTNPVSGNTLNIELNEENIQIQARQERLNIHSRAYTAGWITRKIFSKINCKLCKNNLLAREGNATHKFIQHKEYKTKIKRKLSYPAEHVVISFGHIIKYTNEYLEQHCHDNNLSEKIKSDICSKYSFEFINCPCHKGLVIEYFTKIAIKLCIFNWCNVINKILKGTDVIRAQKCNLQPMQVLALNKFKKKIKNKNFNK